MSRTRLRGDRLLSRSEAPRVFGCPSWKRMPASMRRWLDDNRRRHPIARCHGRRPLFRDFGQSCEVSWTNLPNMCVRHTFVICSRCVQSRQVDFAAQNNSGKECGDGSRLLHLAACGLLLWFSQISIGRTLTRMVDSVPPGSAGRGRLVDPLMARRRS